VSTIYLITSFCLLIFILDAKLVNKIILTLTAITFLTLVIINSERIKERLIFNTLESTNLASQNTFNYKKLYIYSIAHHGHILAAYDIFKENILFGSGAKMFRKICDKRYNVNEHSCTTHPHNLIMQFLSETGILGFLFYVLSLFYVLLKLLKIFKLKIFNKISDFQRCQFFFLTALLISVFPILPSGSFFNNWIGIISFLPVGLYLSTIMKRN
jgi:O-antigen ligase